MHDKSRCILISKWLSLSPIKLRQLCHDRISIRDKRCREIRLYEIECVEGWESLALSPSPLLYNTYADAYSFTHTHTHTHVLTGRNVKPSQMIPFEDDTRDDIEYLCNH